MIGILILAWSNGVHILGTYSPLKITVINYQELLLIFYLQTLFVISLYSSSNSIAVNTLLAMAMVQFVIFLLCQKPWCRNIRKADLASQLKIGKYLSSVKSNQTVTLCD